MVNFIVRYFENLEEAVVACMRPFAWVLAVTVALPLVVGAAVMSSGVITDNLERWHNGVNWLAAAAILPLVTLGALTTALCAVNVVVTATNPESTFRGD